MALDYLEIKEFPSEIMPIVKGVTEVVSWYRNGELSARKRDALLVGTNAAAYAIGQGANLLGPILIGAAESEDGDAIASTLESTVAEASPSNDGTVKAFNPILFVQIAGLIIQLIKTLKS